LKNPSLKDNPGKPSLPNTVIKGLYQILSPFRETDKAFLFKGKHLENGLPIVIKIIKDRFVNSPDFISDYTEELETANAMSKSSNIVKMYDFNYITQRFCVVSEYFNSWSINRILSEKYVLPIHVALRLLKQMAQTTGFAYREGINQRHLKLDNGLLDVNSGLFKITHFSKSGSSKISRSLKNKRFSMTSDVLSFGVLLYRLFCFSYPFENKAELPEIVVDTLETNLKRNYKEVPPADVKAICDLFISSTTRDLSRRLESYDQFINAVDSILIRCETPKNEAKAKILEEKESLLSTAYDTVAALKGELHLGEDASISAKELASLHEQNPGKSSHGLLVWGNKPESALSLDSPIVTFVLIGLTTVILLGLVFKLFI
jgi:serine/threonine protein kinase